MRSAACGAATSGFSARHHVQPEAILHGKARRARPQAIGPRERDEDVGRFSDFETEEAPRRHANHGDRQSVHQHRPSDDGRIAAEARLPETVAEDRDGPVSRATNPRPMAGCDAEDGEVIVGDDQPGRRVGEIAGAQIQLNTERRRIPSPPGRRARAGKRIADMRSCSGRSPRAFTVVTEDETLRLRHRQRAQQYRIDQGENRGIGADSERQRQDGRGGEAGIPAQHPRRIHEVLPRIAGQPARRTAGRNGRGLRSLTQRPHLARQQIVGADLVVDLGQRQAHRLVVRRAAGPQLLVAVVEMLRQLVDDFALARRTERQARQPGGEGGSPTQACSGPVICLIASTNSRQLSRCAASTFRPSAVRR